MATVPIGPLAWKLSYALVATLKSKKKKKKGFLPRELSCVAQHVKDLVLSLQRLGLLLWCRFDSWPRNFHMPQAWPKKKGVYLEMFLKHYITKAI